MKITIGSYKFYGFYESIFNNSSDFIDYDAELQAETENPNAYYDYADFKEYQMDVTREFMDLYYNSIMEILPDHIKNMDFFKLQPLPESLELESPKYYNYRTDRPYMDLITNIETMNLIKWYVLNLPGASQYLKDNHSSRSGFISFISNDLKYWKETPAAAYPENYQIALFDMLQILTEPERIEELQMETYYNIDKYAYLIECTD